MIPEFGQMCLILALCLAVVLSVLPVLGVTRARSDWISVARPAAVGLFVFVSLAFSILGLAFLTDDFSVLYVASNSSVALPDGYKFVAIWGGHE